MTQTKAELLQTRHQGDIRLGDADSSHYVGFKAPATVGTSLVWTLPAADGTANYLLKTDGSGNLGWVADSSTDSTKMPLAGGTFTGDVTFSGAANNVVWDKSANSLLFADDAYAKFGAANDLQIHHSGSHSFIQEAGTGSLYLDSSALRVRNYANSNTMAQFIGDGAVELYHNNVKKFETFASGITVLGSEGSAGQIQLFSDEGDDDADKWRLTKEAGNSSFRIQNYTSGSWETNILATGDGAVELYHDNVKVFNTVGSGITVLGPEGGSAFINMYADEGDDNADKYHLKVEQDGTGFYIKNDVSGSTETNLRAVGNGAVELYHNNVKTLATQANGITVLGPEGGHAEVLLYADEGDDNADKWRTQVDTSGNFKIGNYSTGSWVNGLTLDGSNNASFAGTVSDSKGDLRKIPINAQSSSYTLVSSDAGKTIRTDSGVTVPAGVFYEGEAITIYNNSGSDITITQGANQTTYNAADAATGNRTLAGRGLCTVLCFSNNQFVISGAGLS